jgi:nicotinate dehydrogenase subunit B
VRGRGFAYALYVHSKFPGYGAAWSAWIADVAVNKATGDVSVTRVVAGQDSGLMINPDGVRHQIHGNVIQSTSRALMEEVSFDRNSVTSREWGAYPIIKFPDVPKIDVLMLPRQDQPPLGVGESASVPSAAAIANAIFDATGVRFRELPFTPERILAGIARRGDAAKRLPAPAPRRPIRQMAKSVCRTARRARDCRGAVRRRDRHRRRRAAVAAIAPIARPDASVYSAATIARGQQLAALGDCAVCHTRRTARSMPAAGRSRRRSASIYSTNITPDVETGIGAWSYPAFERAMREGIHRDGRHLYPAFPYTHFAKTTDADMQALYAYLMAQRRCAPRPENTLAFPFNLRPLMAGWNALFHQPNVSKPTRRNRRHGIAAPIWSKASAIAAPAIRRATRSARKRQNAYLAGGFAEGWEAPPLTSLSQAPIPWSEDELYAYLRTGESRFHGVAAGRWRRW